MKMLWLLMVSLPAFAAVSVSPSDCEAPGGQPISASNPRPKCTWTVTCPSGAANATRNNQVYCSAGEATEIKNLISGTQAYLGDTIVLPRGLAATVTNMGMSPKLGNPSEKLTIKVADYEKHFRPGYRLNEDTDAVPGSAGNKVFAFETNTTDPILAFGELYHFMSSIDTAADTITVTGTPGYTQGMEVTVGFARTTGVLCHGDNLPSIDAQTAAYDFPCSGRSGYFTDRFNAFSATVTDGQPARISAFTMPPELTDGGTYYVRDVATSPYKHFRFAATPGGAAVDGGNGYFQTGTPGTYGADGFYVELPLLPLQQNVRYYVQCTTDVAVGQSCGSNTIKLGTAAKGGVIDLTGQAPSTLTVLQPRTARVDNIVWRGIEFRPALNLLTVFLVGIGRTSGTRVFDDLSFPAGWEMHHVYVHGNFREWMSSGIIVDGRDFTLKDSVCKDIAHPSADAQCVVGNPVGQIVIENNKLAASGESIMFGGASAPYFGFRASGFTIRRNAFWKPMYWQRGITISGTGLTNAFRLASRFENISGGAGVVDCGTAYGNRTPPKQCFGYTADEVRYVLTQDNIFSSLSGNGYGFIALRRDGTWEFRHQTALTVGSCAAEFTCVDGGATPLTTMANDTTILYGITVSNNGATFSGTVSAMAGGSGPIPALLKNDLEFKIGAEATIEGNYFRNAPLDPAGQYQNYTPHYQGSSNMTEPHNWTSPVFNHVVRYNIFRDACTAASWTSSGNINADRIEIRFGPLGGKHVFHDNLAVGIGTHLVGAAYQNCGNALRTNAPYIKIFHNTLVDLSGTYFVENSMDQTRGDWQDYDSNVVVPILKSSEIPHFGGGVGGGQLGWYQTSRFHNKNGRWRNNLLDNRNGVSYATGWRHTNSTTCDALTPAQWTPANGTTHPCMTPTAYRFPTTTYLVSNADANRDPVNFFTTWNTYDCKGGASATAATCSVWETSNYRITAAARVTYPSHDGKVIGANIDKIEAMMGVRGADVIAGRPPFSERSSRQVQIGSTSVVVSYVPQTTGESCTIDGWLNDLYGTTPDVTTTDAGATLLGGRKHVTITVTANTSYWFRRTCGTEIDMWELKTLAATPAVSVQVNGAQHSAATAVIESGTSAGSLAADTPVACTTTCRLTVPSGHTFYRVAYRNGGGSVIARSDVTAVP